jgi:hypothetical protein
MVHHTKKEFQKAILNTCKTYRTLCPIIIINDSFSEELCKMLCNKKLPVHNLATATSERIDSCIETFSHKTDGFYKIVLISSDQGRGLDF